MKLEIDVDDIRVDDYSATVGDLIRDEVVSAIRSAVKAEVKAFRKQIAAEVSRVSRGVLAQMKKESINEVAKRIAAEIGP